MEYQQITKLTKNKNSKYWETDVEYYGEKLFICNSVRIPVSYTHLRAHET
jgi:hypothetical protein